MKLLLEQFQALARTIGILDVIDTGLVAFFLYRIYIMLKNTRAAALVKGLMVLAALVIVSKWLNLHVINWILEKAMTMMMVALPVVFQPELRRALEDAFSDCRSRLKRVLLLVPDYTRYHSDAGKIANIVYHMLEDTCRVDLLEAVAV